jgi:hypothetical protein
MARYDVLGMYLARGHVSRKDVLSLWAEPAYLAWVAARPFIDYRQHEHRYRPWPFFAQLADLSSTSTP